MIVRLLYLLFVLATTTHSHKVGLLLNKDDPDESTAIRNIAEFALKTLDNSETPLELEIVEHDDNYLSSTNTICSLLATNVVAILTASGSSLAAVEANVVTQYGIPLVSAVSSNPYIMNHSKESFLLNLSPSDVHQSKVIFDLLKQYKWVEFSILASADDYGINGMVHLQYLASRDGRFNIKDVQHFSIHKDVEAPLQEKLFEEELSLIKSSLSKVIVLNCEGKFAKRIFKEADAMGLMEESFVWIATDGVTSRVEDIAYGGSYSFPSFYKGLLGTSPYYGVGSASYDQLTDAYIDQEGSVKDFRLSSVRVLEGIRLLHEALKEMDKGSWSSVPSVSCEAEGYWTAGNQLLQTLQETALKGLYRVSEPDIATYDVMNFRNNDFEQVGIWKSSQGLLDVAGREVNWPARQDVFYLGGGLTPPSGFGSTLTGYHIRIGIVPEPPIAFLKDECGSVTSSPDCWYGWNPDIIGNLAKDLNFTYEYVMPADKKYGGFNKQTKTWNGMIKDLLDRKTDMTIALSINTERSEYIDYTASFFEDQASFIVYTKESASSSNTFFFLEPFDLSVWATIIGLIVVIASFTTFFSKFSPFGAFGRKIHAMQTCGCEECVTRRKTKKKNSCRFVDTIEYECAVQKCDEEHELNELNMLNSTWLIGTGFVLQGTDVLPTAPSGRFLLFSWWLTIMILTSMYTANLTAHLTLERSSITIQKLPDLLDQNEYAWGMITDRNLESMMLNHRDEVYRNIAERAFKFDSLDDGIRKVTDEGYVFIDESSVLTYNFREDCQAILINTGGFNNEWAFGIQVNSPYVAIINNMFLQYRETGWFTSKFDQWYKGSSESECSTSVGSDSKFTLPILSGLFMILGGGVCISIFLAILEMLYVAYSDSVKHNKSVCRCLQVRISLKFKEMREEWFGRKTKRGFRGGNGTSTGSWGYSEKTSGSALDAPV